MWSGIFGAIKAWGQFALALIRRDERLAHEKAGRLKEREEHWHDWIDAETDMDAVPPGSKHDTVDRLRRGGF